MRIPTPSRLAALLLAALTATLAATLLGCSPQAAPKELTQRQRDSTLGATNLPGAFVVTRALKESDKAAGAAQKMDAQVDSIGR